MMKKQWQLVDGENVLASFDFNLYDGVNDMIISDSLHRAKSVDPEGFMMWNLITSAGSNLVNFKTMNETCTIKINEILSLLEEIERDFIQHRPELRKHRDLVKALNDKS